MQCIAVYALLLRSILGRMGVDLLFSVAFYAPGPSCIFFTRDVQLRH